MATQVIVSNNIRISGAPAPLVLQFTKDLTIDNPEYKKRKVRRQPTWGCDPKLKLYSQEGGIYILPRGYYGRLWKLIVDGYQDMKYCQSDDVTLGRSANFGKWNPRYEPREQQLKAVEYGIWNSGCIVAPAGGGKTLIGLRIIHDSIVTALWLTHTIDLMKQAADRAKQYMPDIGEIGMFGGGKSTWGDGNLIIASLQTLQSRPDLIEQLNAIVGVVIVDECHHLPATSFLDTIGKLKACRVVGLTATPDRKDGLEMYMYMGVGPKLYELSRADLYETGKLVKPEIRFIFTEFSYEQASIRNAINSVDAGGEQLDYRELLDKLIADDERAELIAQTVSEQKGYQLVIADSKPYCHKLEKCIREEYTKKGKQVPRIAVVHGPLQRLSWIVCSSEKEAKKLVEMGKAVECKYDKSARRWKIRASQYTAEEFKAWDISKVRRADIMDRANKGCIDILIATGQLVQEGLDLPFLQHGHLTTPKRGDAAGGKNGASVEQAIGRIMRSDPKNPNKIATWWDYVDYKVGVLKSQYSSRRTVYTRLGLKCPKKERTTQEDLCKLLEGLKY